MSGPLIFNIRLLWTETSEDRPNVFGVFAQILMQNFIEYVNPLMEYISCYFNLNLKPSTRTGVAEYRNGGGEHTKLTVKVIQHYRLPLNLSEEINVNASWVRCINNLEHFTGHFVVTYSSCIVRYNRCNPKLSVNTTFRKQVHRSLLSRTPGRSTNVSCTKLQHPA